MTWSLCPECRALVPAKVASDGRDVLFRKFCPEHGERESFVWSDVARYLATQRFVKPAWTPRNFAGNAAVDCPDGCGLCARHEQHLCMPVIEITSRCDLACPACLVNAGEGRDMSLAEFRSVLDSLLHAERQIDVLNLSGGEPLLHPRLPALINEALARPEVVRVSVSTNGLALLAHPGRVRHLRERNVVLSLQFDGFDDRAYVRLRGRPLLEEKRRILDRLAEEGITTSLTMTAARGINDDAFRPILDYLFSHEHVVSLMIQPIAFAGRAAALNREARLSIPDVIDALSEAGHPAVRGDDFVPLPCSHPLCFSLAFYLMTEGGGAISLNRLADAKTVLDSISNRVIFGLDPHEHERLKAMLYDLWSGPAGAAPDGEAVIRTVRAILRELSSDGFEPRRAFTVAERRVKSIFIHAFQDADTFDLARARRCCQAYPQRDGRFVPACIQNCLRRP
jgi:hypothetical protein